MNKMLVLALAVLLFFNVAGTGYTYTLYTDQTAWENAVGTFATETFPNSIDQATKITFESGIESEVLGTLHHPFHNLVTVVGSFYGFVNVTGNQDIVWDFDSINSISAFGADFGSLNVPSGLTVTGNFDGSGDQTASIAGTIGATSGFFGLVGLSVFDTLQWSSNDGNEFGAGESFYVRNFSYTASSGGSGPPGGTPVPEPTTILLFGTGLVGLVGVRLRRKK